MNNEVTNQQADEQQNIKQQTSEQQETKPLTNSDKIVLQNEALKFKRMALNDKAKITYQQLPAFSNITVDVAHFMNWLDDAKANKDDQLVLKNNARTLYDGLKNTYQAGIKENIKKLEQWQQDYRKAYAQQLEPEDPQREAVKRQSFNVEIDALDNDGLMEYVQTLNERPTLNRYEANKLLASVKGNTNLYSQVKSYMKSNNIGSEYKNTPEWNNIAKQLFTLKGFANRNDVWYLKDGHLQPFNLSDVVIKNLKDYKVIDIEQRKKYFGNNH